MPTTATVAAARAQGACDGRRGSSIAGEPSTRRPARRGDDGHGSGPRRPSGLRAARDDRGRLVAHGLRSWLDRLGLHRRELRAWAYYDVANSAFMTTVLMIFPVYFVRVPAAGLAAEVARSRFAFATSLAVVLVGLLGPFLGAVADYRGSKKAFLGAFLALGASATAALASRHGRALGLRARRLRRRERRGHLHPRLLQRPPARDRLGERGRPRLHRRLRLGYLGGGVLFALNLWMISSPATFGLPTRARPPGSPS